MRCALLLLNQAACLIGAAWVNRGVALLDAAIELDTRARRYARHTVGFAPIFDF
jgi:hypothetical protein